MENPDKLLDEKDYENQQIQASDDQASEHDVQDNEEEVKVPDNPENE